MKKLIAALLVLPMAAPAAKLCRKVINQTTYTIGDATFVVDKHNFTLTAPGVGLVFCGNNYDLFGDTANLSTSLPKISKTGDSWTFTGNAAWGTTCYGITSKLTFYYLWRNVSGAFINGLYIDIKDGRYQE
ncbi:MAG: hypothetical protein LBL46_04420 [Rickettsiales bacterium]|nr:hypothetical protein [Rickettsiales bacterium]